MRYFMLICVLCVPPLITSGCATNGLPVNAERMAEAYYGQDDEIESFSASGVSEFVIKGWDMDLKISNTKPIKSVIPKNPSTASKVIDAVGSVGRTAIGAYVAGKIIDKEPTVIEQPEPKMIEPIFIPR